MVRTTRLLLVLALLGGALTAPRSHAQTADGPATAAAETSGPALTTEPEFLKTLPRPPDEPRSLLAPPPPLGPPPPDLERPYFQPDPLVDPPSLGLPGLFADVDADFLKPHLVNELHLPVTFPDGSSTTVGVNPTHLNWTVSPRFEVGYRLPSGFGGIALSYRFMVSQGSETAVGADGPATLSSRLDMNMADLDWVSNEYTPWQLCDMRVRFGLRYIYSYFDSQANEPFAEAAAGSTIYSQRTTNSNWVIGPHVGVDLRRRLNYGGLAILGLIDMSEGWGRVRQGYFASSTTSASGLPQAGEERISTSDAVPVVTARLGLNWQPPTYPNCQMFAGYQFDYFWNIGRAGNFTTFGYFFDSGIVLRAAWNF
jgi:Legionella pneumophila major outer membrane protein precursor